MRYEFKNKEEIIRNSNSWCQVCGTRRDRLDLHHVYPDSEGHKDWILVLLCRKHHKQVDHDAELIDLTKRIAQFQKETGRRYNPLTDKV